jgi:hypothetical protein
MSSLRNGTNFTTLYRITMIIMFQILINIVESTGDQIGKSCIEGENIRKKTKSQIFSNTI